MSYLDEFARLFNHLVWPVLSHPLACLETAFPTYFSFAGRRFSPDDIPSLDGKVIVITGGNDGLGKETVFQLANHRPRKIFLAARDRSKANRAISSILSQLAEKVDITFVPLDLTSLQSVQTAADTISHQCDRLDILILNAGVMALPASTTEAGFEIHMATNHVGHFLLTKLLLPLLRQTAEQPDSDCRVVVVSSEAHRVAPNINTITSTTKLSNCSPLTRYAASKAANILYAAEFPRRFPSIMAVSLHPGVIMTELYRTGQEDGNWTLWLMKIAKSIIMQDVAEGARTQLWCAVGANRDALNTGAYYTVQQAREWNVWANDEAAAKRLWEWTEQELERATL